MTLFQGKRQPTKTNPQLVQIQEFANKDFKENIFIVNEKIRNVSKYRNNFLMELKFKNTISKMKKKLSE